MIRGTNEDPLINYGHTRTVKKKKYDCCNNKDVCIMLFTVSCIVLSIGGLTILNIYFIQKEDGSL